MISRYIYAFLKLREINKSSLPHSSENQKYIPAVHTKHNLKVAAEVGYIRNIRFSDIARRIIQRDLYFNHNGLLLDPGFDISLVNSFLVYHVQLVRR